MELFSLQSFFFFLLFIFLFIIFCNQNSSKKSNCIRTYPVLGILPEFIRNRHRFLDWLTEFLEKHPTNTITFRHPGKFQGVVTANPINVEYMLKTNFENYPKGDEFIALLEDFLGRGIFNSDGHLWKLQRKTASFEFNTKSLRNFVMENVQQEIRNRLLPLLCRAAKNNEIIDLQDILECFAFDNVCKVAFNEDPACLNASESCNSGKLSPEFAKAFEDATNLCAGRFMSALPFVWKIKKFFNVGSERRLRESISTVHEFATKIIRARKKDKENTPQDSDLLSRFISNEDNNSEEFLRDIIVSFILAGRDTTSSSLAWFFWLLASRPKIEKNILEELKSIRNNVGKNHQEHGEWNKSPNETFSFEELREMHYLHASISEALRLYPAVPVDTKVCLEDDVMPDGTFVGKGWSVTYNTYAMGRMKSIWGENCRSFKPERWLENGVFRPENPFRFPVFHAGPRMCLGKEMAYIQMKSIVACVIERFEIEVEGKGQCPEHVLSLTLRMKGGLPLKVRERSRKKED
ncbi:cytochrome P450 CYP94D108-like [Tasmannia lanceolata]|uniref:cytochrome P450 CYP94D108-like n=1 Tax=Tasmannia lanceolata TaxID=3420 RepID=UPI004062C257